jgi:hypothetical protein
MLPRTGQVDHVEVTVGADRHVHNRVGHTWRSCGDGVDPGEVRLAAWEIVVVVPVVSEV